MEGKEHKDIMSEMEERDIGFVEGSLERFAGTAPLIGWIVQDMKALVRDMKAPGNILLASP